MIVRLVNSEYDPHTERGYVEFRANNDDGGEMIISCILTFRSKSKLSKHGIKQECLLEGAERGQNLLRRWSSQAPVPMTGDKSLVG